MWSVSNAKSSSKNAGKLHLHCGHWTWRAKPPAVKHYMFEYISSYHDQQVSSRQDASTWYPRKLDAREDFMKFSIVSVLQLVLFSLTIWTRDAEIGFSAWRWLIWRHTYTATYGYDSLSTGISQDEHTKWMTQSLATLCLSCWPVRTHYFNSAGHEQTLTKVLQLKYSTVQ